jgi:hypothetical protein
VSVGKREWKPVWLARLISEPKVTPVVLRGIEQAESFAAHRDGESGRVYETEHYVPSASVTGLVEAVEELKAAHDDRQGLCLDAPDTEAELAALERVELRHADALDGVIDALAQFKVEDN